MDKDVKTLLLITGGVFVFWYLKKQGYLTPKAEPPVSPLIIPQTPQTGLGHPPPCNFDEEYLGTPDGSKCVPKTIFSPVKQFQVIQDFSVDINNPNYRGQRTIYFNTGDLISGGYITYYKYNYDTAELEKVTDLITLPNGNVPSSFDNEYGLADGEVVISIPKEAVSEVGGIRPIKTTIGGYAE